MFGWLPFHAMPCSRATPIAASRRARRIAPGGLIEMLPALGSVLYLHAGSSTVLPDELPHRLLVPRACAPLLSAHWLVAVSVVTDDGPHEWCECVDAFGRTQARWHVLPDTDYLAWEAMVRPCAVNVSLPSMTQPLRPGRAALVNFRLRHVAGLTLLEHQASPLLSPLGERIATRIANAESVMRGVP